MEAADDVKLVFPHVTVHREAVSHPSYCMRPSIRYHDKRTRPPSRPQIIFLTWPRARKCRDKRSTGKGDALVTLSAVKDTKEELTTLITSAKLQRSAAKARYEWKK